MPEQLMPEHAIAPKPMSRPLFTIFDKVDGSEGEFSLKEQRRYHLEMWALLGDPATRLL